VDLNQLYGTKTKTTTTMEKKGKDEKKPKNKNNKTKEGDTKKTQGGSFSVTEALTLAEKHPIVSKMPLDLVSKLLRACKKDESLSGICKIHKSIGDLPISVICDIRKRKREQKNKKPKTTKKPKTV
jgi:hypothetical protein